MYEQLTYIPWRPEGWRLEGSSQGTVRGEEIKKNPLDSYSRRLANSGPGESSPQSKQAALESIQAIWGQSYS